MTDFVKVSVCAGPGLECLQPFGKALHTKKTQALHGQTLSNVEAGTTQKKLPHISFYIDCTVWDAERRSYFVDVRLEESRLEKLVKTGTALLSLYKTVVSILKN